MKKKKDITNKVYKYEMMCGTVQRKHQNKVRKRQKSKFMLII